jgi:uncharacterized protein
MPKKVVLVVFSGTILYICLIFRVLKKTNMIIARNIDKTLLDWKTQEKRKPLLLRGARQVGKSTAVRVLSKHFEYFIEINFELETEAHAFFSGNLNPKAICDNLSLYFDIPIVEGKTLLFFDEIQACLPAISSLRFFYEKWPALHLISAGSLLEFALEQLPSFGVGRVRSVFVYPFSFDEFLGALGEQKLVALKQAANAEQPLLLPFHQKLTNYFKFFLIIGGMPEAVAHYANGGDLLGVQTVLDDLLISIQSDFSKYKKRVPSIRISEVFDSIIRQTGGKFVFTKAATQATLIQIKEAVGLLTMAGLVIPITHTSANGIPLGAETDDKKRKLILLDTGLYQRALGLNIGQLMAHNDFETINKGAIAEMFVGLEWLKYGSPFQSQNLYYWHRETANSNAEIDYVVQQGEQIVPIEVKASNKGAMQSMFVFLKEKNKTLGVRFSLENFSEYPPISVYPLYAVSNFSKYTNEINKNAESKS